MANSWQEAMKPIQKGFSGWVVIATVSAEFSGSRILTLELWGVKYTGRPCVAGEGRRGAVCLTAARTVFPAWGTWGNHTSVPSAFAAVTPFLTTYLTKQLGTVLQYEGWQGLFGKVHSSVQNR